MPNTNCLDGMACPKCGSTGPFRITSICLAEWTDDGIVETENFEVAANYLPALDHVQCSGCDHIGGIAEFGGSDRVQTQYTITLDWDGSFFSSKIPEELKGLVELVIRDYDVDLERDEAGRPFIYRNH